MKSDSRVFLASPVTTSNVNPSSDIGCKRIPGSVHGSSAAERGQGMLHGFQPIFRCTDTIWGELFKGKWNTGEGEGVELYHLHWEDHGIESTHHHGFVSTQQFLMDIGRFRGLLPLDNWEQPPELMWRL